MTTAVDSLIKRIKVDPAAIIGPAGASIEPLRQRLRLLRSPLPLHFVGLMFDPLGPLIVPASRWLPGRHTIPRTALAPLAEVVRQEMGSNAQAIEAEIAGHTNAETGLIARLGRSLWPVAARILGEPKTPQAWEATGLGTEIYQPIADTVAALLGQAVPLDILYAETANGLLPPSPERIGILLDAGSRPGDLAMLIALLLVRLPAVVATIQTLQAGSVAKAMKAALDQAADRILLYLAEDEGMEMLIAAGTLADAGATAARIATLLDQLATGLRKPQRRGQPIVLRRRLDDGCKARFTLGLQEELLAPLQNLRPSPDPHAIQDLETAARGLRILALEARAVGSGATYDSWLHKATETVRDSAMRERLTQVDQVRLVELLSGPDVALEMLETPR